MTCLYFSWKSRKSPKPLHYALLTSIYVIYTIYNFNKEKRYQHAFIMVLYLFFAYSLFLAFCSSVMLWYLFLSYSFLFFFSFSDIVWYLFLLYSLFFVFFFFRQTSIFFSCLFTQSIFIVSVLFFCLNWLNWHYSPLFIYIFKKIYIFLTPLFLTVF